MRNFLWKIIPLSIIAVLGGSGCTPPFPPPAQTLTPRVELTLYVSPTPTPTPGPFPTPNATQQPKLPTPTPFTHTIQEGDTLSGIALRYNTSVDEIMAANPGINPNLLIIGEEVVIPAGDEEAVTHLPTATPLPLSLEQPHCLPANQGGLWCFVEVANPLDIALENVSAVVSVYSIAGEVAASEVALPPLNALPPGGSLPLMAYFSPPLPETFQASVTLLTALPAPGPGPQTTITDQEIAYASDRQQATLSGTITLSEESLPVSHIWVAGIAYDVEGNIVGSRKLIIETELSPGQSTSFELTVFSLGPAIDHVRVIDEGRD